MDFVAKLVIFLPLLSGVINGVYCKRITNCVAGYVAAGSLGLTAISACVLFFHAGVEKQLVHVVLSSWIHTGDLDVHWAIYVDQLTAIMFVLVTIVSAVVHIYSLGYMADDDNLPKFLSYLSLFTFFMLALVSGDNFLQLFFGWEGVGLCSYLLIGYYFKKDSANQAAIKAFVTNRVGDFALIIGIVLIFWHVGSIDFAKVFAHAKELSHQNLEVMGVNYPLLDVICLLLFIGCMGKSAQIGLHVWLPDAMEGPTPVSALIHAATMVTAGVFLLARCSFMFEYSPNVLAIITVVGAVTCLFAASVAIAQEDIKKIIAYSTCSQLGYMFFACGVSAYQVGVFHLVTHGFFKALLFLSAGSVIHACHEQDIFKMGGLRKKLPITYANFWLGSLAIIGIFPLAGFYSKDLVLESAYAAGGMGSIAFILGLVAAILTAIYSMKIILLTFHGETRLSHESFDHAHESPRIMNLPLMMLVLGTIFSGMIGAYVLHIDDPKGYFAGSMFNLHAASHDHHHIDFIIKIMPLVVGVAGMMIGYFFYKGDRYLCMASKLKPIFIILKNKYYFDEIYNQLFVKTTNTLSKVLALFDIKVIDKFGPNGFSLTTRAFSWCVCQIQTGYIFNYTLYIILAVIACITVFLVKYYNYISGWSF